jgi:hypothetical protein
VLLSERTITIDGGDGRRSTSSGNCLNFWWRKRHEISRYSQNLQNVGYVSILERHCFFATSQNGWITEDLRIYDALGFTAQVSECRLSLPQAIRANEILLVIDGHKSRLSFVEAMIF